MASSDSVALSVDYDPWSLTPKQWLKLFGEPKPNRLWTEMFRILYR